MTIVEAFTIVNNLDVDPALRGAAPLWSAIVIDRSGEILDVTRYRQPPFMRSYYDERSKHPGSLQIPAWPGRFGSAEDLAGEIQESVSLLDA